MNAQDILRKLASLKRAPGRGDLHGMKAPHKPLLLLALLSRIESGKTVHNRFLYDDLKSVFDALWHRFGWNSPTKSAYPFWYLASEGFWTLQGKDGPLSIAGWKVPGDVILDREVRYGEFSDEAWLVLQDPATRRRAMDFLVETYFPPSRREELREELGMTWPRQEVDPAGGRRVLTAGRDPYEQKKFRDTVLLAYGRRCAVCDFGPRQERAPSAIAAAHIWPVEHGGPFDVDNGLALCPVHHWAVDSGTMGFMADGIILVSARVTDGEMLRTYVQAHAGSRLRMPLSKYPKPNPKYLRLHRDHLFQGDPL